MHLMLIIPPIYMWNSNYENHNDYKTQKKIPLYLVDIDNRSTSLTRFLKWRIETPPTSSKDSQRVFNLLKTGRQKPHRKCGKNTLEIHLQGSSLSLCSHLHNLHTIDPFIAFSSKSSNARPRLICFPFTE